MVNFYQVSDDLINRKNLIHVGMLSGLSPQELLKADTLLPKSHFSRDEAFRFLNALPKSEIGLEKTIRALRTVFKEQDSVTITEFEEIAVNVIGLPTSAIQLVKDKYPAHLAAAARRQAEGHLLGPITMETAVGEVSPAPREDPGASDDAACSDSGRTYTVSDNSEDGHRGSPKSGKLSAGSYAKDEGSDPAVSAGGRSPPKANGREPPSLGAIPAFKPRVKAAESPPLDRGPARRKSASESAGPRGFSSDLRQRAKAEAMKNRSISFDYRTLSSTSSSEIANKYLPDSLKNLVDLEDTPEDGDAVAGLPSSRNDAVDLQSNSSEGEVHSAVTLNFTSTSSSREKHSKVTTRRSYSLTTRKASASSSPLGLKSGASSFRLQNGGNDSCPVHGHKPHTHNGASTPSTTSSRSRKTTPPPASPPPSITPRSPYAESQLHCGICTKRFKEPKVLPCLHTFCERCLASYTPPESLTLTCPICRQQSILPKDGVAGLQTNRWLGGMADAMATCPVPPGPCSHCGGESRMTCVECDLVLCIKCGRRHEQDSGSECHSVISLEDSSSRVSCSDPVVTDDAATLYCPLHEGQTLRFYCRDCERSVCITCMDIEHRSHATIRLDEAAEAPKDDLERLVDKVTVQLPYMKEALCDLGDVTAQLDVNKKTSESDVRTCFRGLQDLLDQRQTELINSLNTSVTAKKDAIETQREELSRWVEGVERCCEYVEKTLPTLPPSEMVLAKNQMGEKLRSYVGLEFPPIPRENAYIEFDVGNIDPLKNAFKHAGRIQTNSAVPQQTTAIGDALKKALVGRQNVITVVTWDHKGARIKSGGAEVKATIAKVTTIRNGHHQQHATNGDTRASPGSTRTDSLETQVVDLNNGAYEVCFSVQSIGTYTLALLLHGQHITASPFTLEARMPDADDRSDGGTPPHREPVASGSLKRQTSRSTQGTRRVSTGSNTRPPSHKSSGSRRTLKEPLEDDLILKVGRRGRSRGEFVNPQGVCYSSVKDGRIVIADSNNQCVQVFNLSGECKVKFGVRGRSVGQLQRPTGVAALPDGHYAVADYENRWISVFEPSGKYVHRIGHGKLLGPKGMCITREGHIIVVDNKASSILVFHPSGKLINKFGNRILEGYNFAGPHFCAVNSKGDIIVTDFHNHCVRVFTSEGIAKFTFGTNGEGNGQFNAPTGLAVDANDNIIVADWGNSRIQVFDCQGSFLSFVNTLADPLYGPQGLTLTAEGDIVVADSGNHCFKIYKYLQ